MKRLWILSTVLLAVTISAAAGAFAQTPTAAAVVNAASYTVAGLPNAAIAQGSLFIVFGTNMGPGTLVSVPKFPLTPTLGGTSINITVSGTTTQALMIYTSAGQVAAVMPSRTPVGTGTLTVGFNGQTSAPLAVTVVQSSFGAFTLNQAGSGAAVILDGNFNAITVLHPAAPGQTVALWGTGVGPVSGDESQPPAGGDMGNVPVEVYVGTAKAPVVYRGRAPGFAGVDQINFQIPSGQLGCNVSVSVKIGLIVSNLTSLAVGNGGVCSDTNGLDANALQILNANGALRVGSVVLSKISTQITLPGFSQTTTSESGGGGFFSIDKSVLLQGSSGGSSGGSSVSQPSIGSCSITTFRSQSGSGGGSGSSTLAGYTGLDAGPAITVTGPNGSRQMTPIPQVRGSYGASFAINGQPSYLVPGSYTFSGTGGVDVGAFSATASGSPISWSNSGNISTINRSQDLLITWTGGSANGLVEISGSSTLINIQGTVTTSITGSFLCWTQSSAGQFSVPAAVLLALPTSSQQVGGTLFVGGESLTSITIPGIDYALVGFLDLTGKSVNYQ